MDDREFAEGLRDKKGDQQEWTDAAEAFVRMQKRSERPEPREEETEKTAGRVMDFAEGTVAGLLHHKDGADMVRRAMKSAKLSRSSKAGFSTGMALPFVGTTATAGAVGHHLGKKSKTKEAGVLEHLPADLKNPFLLGAAGAGALGNAIMSHHANKPREELGGKSKGEKAYEELLAQQHAQGEQGQGFLHKVKNRYNEFSGGLSKTFREHPRESTALGAVVGAGAGFGLGKLLGAGAGALRKR